VERGYVVLVLDSLGPRSVTTVCDTITAHDKGGVSIFRGVKDAFDAKAHLAKLAFVDPKRISLVGFSWGGMVGNLAAAKAFTEAFTDKPFTSVVSFYPGCHYHYFPDDIQTPLLVLMGEEDNEVEVPSCVSRLERLREKHAPVQWRVYPGATHSWDWDVEVNKLAFGGKPVRYVPNARVKRDSTEHLFQFLALP